MLDFFRRLFNTDFMPHGHCYFWRPEIVWLHVVSDALITLSYFVIPLALVYLVRKRSDLAFNWMFMLFGVFILACGTTHLMAIWTLWTPVYRLDGVVKAITALASVLTAILLIRLLPQVIELPSAQDLREANAALAQEVAERRSIEKDVLSLNAALEERVHERTRELESSLGSLARAQRIAHVGDWEQDIVSRDLRWSAEIYRIFGVSAGSFTPSIQTFYESVHPEDREAVRNMFDTSAASGKSYRIEHRIVRPDGEERHIRELGEFSLDASGRPVQCMGTVQDITEYKRLEEQFRQANKMEAMGQLAGGVAHDFNNLLTVINGYSSLLLQRLPEGEPIRKTLRGVLDAGERAAALTQRLLAFSRRQVLQPKVLNLNDVVAGMEELLGRLIRADVQFSSVLDPSVRPIRADAVQLEQVILNLVANALDAMPEGGRLTIETANVDFDSSCLDERVGVKPGSYVMLTVKDSGVGIDAQTRSRIFEPFFTTKETGKGTGLGLSMVYGVVKQSDGQIWVYSEPGVGTTFKLCFPVAPGVVVAPTPVPTRPTAGSETILLAEDNEAVRAYASDVLTSEGYVVLAAHDGQEALRLCHAYEGEIHLLLTDIIMPGMNGWELSRQVSAQRPGIRVLYTSGYIDDTIGPAGALADGLSLLEKPFSPTALAQRVRQVLDSVPVRD